MHGVGACTSCPIHPPMDLLADREAEARRGPTGQALLVHVSEDLVSSLKRDVTRPQITQQQVAEGGPSD